MPDEETPPEPSPPPTNEPDATTGEEFVPLPPEAPAPDAPLAPDPADLMNRLAGLVGVTRQLADEVVSKVRGDFDKLEAYLIKYGHLPYDWRTKV